MLVTLAVGKVIEEKYCLGQLSCEKFFEPETHCVLYRGTACNFPCSTSSCSLSLRRTDKCPFYNCTLLKGDIKDYSKSKVTKSPYKGNGFAIFFNDEPPSEESLEISNEIVKPKSKKVRDECKDIFLRLWGKISEKKLKKTIPKVSAERVEESTSTLPTVIVNLTEGSTTQNLASQNFTTMFPSNSTEVPGNSTEKNSKIVEEIKYIIGKTKNLTASRKKRQITDYKISDLNETSTAPSSITQGEYKSPAVCNCSQTIHNSFRNKISSEQIKIVLMTLMGNILFALLYFCFCKKSSYTLVKRRSAPPENLDSPLLELRPMVVPKRSQSQ